MLYAADILGHFTEPDDLAVFDDLTLDDLHRLRRITHRRVGLGGGRGFVYAIIMLLFAFASHLSFFDP
jgi:hypothetical protein